MDDFEDLDFAALDAIEAEHLAAKENKAFDNKAQVPHCQGPSKGYPLQPLQDPPHHSYSTAHSYPGPYSAQGQHINAEWRRPLQARRSEKHDPWARPVQGFGGARGHPGAQLYGPSVLGATSGATVEQHGQGGHQRPLKSGPPSLLRQQLISAVLSKPEQKPDAGPSSAPGLMPQGICRRPDHPAAAAGQRATEAGGVAEQERTWAGGLPAPRHQGLENREGSRNVWCSDHRASAPSPSQNGRQPGAAGKQGSIWPAAAPAACNQIHNPAPGQPGHCGARSPFSTDPSGLPGFDDDDPDDFDWNEFDFQNGEPANVVEERLPEGAPLRDHLADLSLVQGAGEPGRADQCGNVPEEGDELAAEDSEHVLMDCKTTNKGIRVHRVHAQKWVYPKGVGERRYQIEIIQTALLHNTLVCLPTGLGKTLIAAVVMHNFSRWFPEGKVVFVAPTRPLVTQQIKACADFMGMPMNSLHELTGHTDAQQRSAFWSMPHKRIFFCTPQTFKNDVCRGICLSEQVTCLVVDECHRATGKADIVLAIRKMAADKCKFRVVGLSATPGKDKAAIQEVVSNLLASRIEVREEHHPDVLEHVHPRSVEVIRVPASTGDLADARQNLLHLIRGVITSLCGQNAYFGNLDGERATRFSFQKERERLSLSGPLNHTVTKLYLQGGSLADIRDQLDKHGVEAACASLTNKKDKLRSLEGNQFYQLFKRQLDQMVRNGTAHPKMAAVKEVVFRHFNLPQPVECTDESAAPLPAELVPGRVIIFSDTRESVDSIKEMLNCHQPAICAKSFIGQGKTGKTGTGQTQKEQQQALADFRAGKFNVLVATCIGEEGLDICQVDMVICFDANQSPIRNIQRAGRTGRHKEGQVVHILSEGAEEEKYRRHIQNTEELYRLLHRQGFDLKSDDPRMLPRQFNPVQLNVNCSAEMPAEDSSAEAPTKGKKGRGGGGRGRAKGGRSAAELAGGLGYAAEADLARKRKRLGSAAGYDCDSASEGGAAEEPCNKAAKRPDSGRGLGRGLSSGRGRGRKAVHTAAGRCSATGNHPPAQPSTSGRDGMPDSLQVGAGQTSSVGNGLTGVNVPIAAQAGFAEPDVVKLDSDTEAGQQPPITASTDKHSNEVAAAPAELEGVLADAMPVGSDEAVEAGAGSLDAELCDHWSPPRQSASQAPDIVPETPWESPSGSHSIARADSAATLPRVVPETPEVGTINARMSAEAADWTTGDLLILRAGTAAAADVQTTIKELGDGGTALESGAGTNDTRVCKPLPRLSESPHDGDKDACSPHTSQLPLSHCLCNGRRDAVDRGAPGASAAEVDDLSRSQLRLGRKQTEATGLSSELEIEEVDATLLQLPLSHRIAGAPNDTPLGPVIVAEEPGLCLSQLPLSSRAGRLSKAGDDTLGTRDSAPIGASMSTLSAAANEPLLQLPLSKRMDFERKRNSEEPGRASVPPEPGCKETIPASSGNIPGRDKMVAHAAQGCGQPGPPCAARSPPRGPAAEDVTLSQMPLWAWPSVKAGEPEQPKKKRAKRRPGTAKRTRAKPAGKAQEQPGTLDDPDLSQCPLWAWPTVKPPGKDSAAKLGNAGSKSSSNAGSKSSRPRGASAGAEQAGGVVAGARHQEGKQESEAPIVHKAAVASTHEEAVAEASPAVEAYPRAQTSVMPWHSSLIAEVTHAARNSGSGPSSEALRLAGAGLLSAPGDNHAKLLEESSDKAGYVHAAQSTPLLPGSVAPVQLPQQAEQAAGRADRQGTLASGPRSNPGCTSSRNPAQPGARGFEVGRVAGVSGFRRLGASGKGPQPKRTEKRWGFAAVLKARKEERAAAQAGKPRDSATAAVAGSPSQPAQPAKDRDRSKSPAIQAANTPPSVSPEAARNHTHSDAEPSRSANPYKDADISAPLDSLSPARLCGEPDAAQEDADIPTATEAETDAPAQPGQEGVQQQFEAPLEGSSVPKQLLERGAGSQHPAQGLGSIRKAEQAAQIAPRITDADFPSLGAAEGAAQQAPGPGLTSLRDRLKASLATSSSAVTLRSSTGQEAAAAGTEAPGGAPPGQELQWGSESMRRKLEQDRLRLSEAARNSKLPPSRHPSAPTATQQQSSKPLPTATAATAGTAAAGPTAGWQNPLQQDIAVPGPSQHRGSNQGPSPRRVHGTACSTVPTGVSAIPPPSEKKIQLSQAPSSSLSLAARQVTVPGGFLPVAACTARVADIARRWGAKLPEETKPREGNSIQPPCAWEGTAVHTGPTNRRHVVLELDVDLGMDIESQPRGQPEHPASKGRSYVQLQGSESLQQRAASTSAQTESPVQLELEPDDLSWDIDFGSPADCAGQEAASPPTASWPSKACSHAQPASAGRQGSNAALPRVAQRRTPRQPGFSRLRAPERTEPAQEAGAEEDDDSFETPRPMVCQKSKRFVVSSTPRQTQVDMPERHIAIAGDLNDLPPGSASQTAAEDDDIDTPMLRGKPATRRWVVSSTPRPSQAEPSGRRGLQGASALKNASLPTNGSDGGLSSGPATHRPRARMKASVLDPDSQKEREGTQQSGRQGGTPTWAERWHQLQGHRSLDQQCRLKRMRTGSDHQQDASPGRRGRGPGPQAGEQKAASTRPAATFVDMEAGLASDAEVSSDEEDEEDGFEADFIDDGMTPAGSRARRGGSEMLMYQRSLIDQTPQFQRLAAPGQRAADILADTPMADSQDSYEADSFLANEDDDGHLLASTLKGGQLEHEDECGLCGQGGKLLCCDGCPGAFHLGCLGLLDSPPGSWFCAVCADGR